MLHLIFQTTVEDAVLARIGVGDDVVFLESAVLGLLQKSELAARLSPMLAGNQFYVLAEDIETRGIAAEELMIGFVVIDYPGLVALTVKHPLIQSWA